MEVVLLFGVGYLVMIIVIFSIVKITTSRMKTPTNDLKNEIENLKERVKELENDKK